MELILTLVVLGVIFYFINLIPMASPMPQIIRAVLVIIAVVLVIRWLGLDLGLPALG